MIPHENRCSDGVVFLGAAAFAVSEQQRAPDGIYAFDFSPTGASLEKAGFEGRCNFTLKAPDGTVSRVVIFSDELEKYLKKFQLPVLRLTFSIFGKG